jgi:hypothetical protein
MNVMSPDNLRGVERDPQHKQDSGEELHMLRRIVCSIGLTCAATAAHAQMGRFPRQATPEPDYWVGLSIGYVEGITTTDDATGATWQFGYTSQIRATLEKTLQRGTTVGIAAGFSNAPLTYTSGFTNGFSVPDGCGGVCRAEADVAQYTIFIHGGGFGGYGGFHGLYNLETGVTQFTNFRDRDSGAKLQPTNGSYDATFGLGGGVGYTITPTADAYAAEMVDFVLHHQSSAVTAQSAPHFFTLRVGFRVGF